MGRRGEALVARAAEAAVCDHGLRAGVREVDEQAAVVVEHLRADRDREDDVLAVGAALVRALAVASALGLEAAEPLEVREIAQVRVGHEHDVAAVAPVAAVGPALRDVLLAPEAQRAVAAAPALDADPRAVVEHRLL